MKIIMTFLRVFWTIFLCSCLCRLNIFRRSFLKWFFLAFIVEMKSKFSCKLRVSVTWIISTVFRWRLIASSGWIIFSREETLKCLIKIFRRNFRKILDIWIDMTCHSYLPHKTLTWKNWMLKVPIIRHNLSRWIGSFSYFFPISPVRWRKEV